MGPLRVMLETRIASRRQHPGLDDEGAELSDLAPITPEMLGGAPRSEEAISPNFIPSFDPESVARPPRPSSSLVDAPADAFKPESHPITGSMIDPLPELPPAAPRSTFIEAARRAAQRQQEPEAASSSLIGRAMARFQSRAHVETATDQPATTDDATQKPAKKGRRKMALVPSSAVEVPSEIELGAPAAVAQDQATEASADALIADAGRESFLVRHRQPILLAASVVALSFLTLNLIGQRFAEEPVASSIEEASTTPAASAEALLPTAPLTAVTEEAATPTTSVLTAAESIEAAAAEGPRMIPMIDSLATGAIARSATQFSPGSTTPTLPQSFQAPASGAAPAVTPESPVKVELPPEGIGPTELREASAGGDPRAQFEVGAIYTEGRAVPKDLAMAATWYERAAAQGFAPAQYRLANLYENGLGVEKNLEQARLWYQRAAEAGNRMSMHNLAALYAGGELGEQDFLAASEWFEKAANQGLTDSQFNLGMLYARGLGVAQNMETSYKWFALAAARGDKDAATARDDVAKSLEADVVNRLAFEVDAWRPEPIDLTANFAPIGTWSETFDPGEVITARDVVLGVQSILTRLGYDVGTPDGVAGPKTAEAISAFEKAIGMPTSGTINPRLLAVLASQPV